MHKNIYIQTPSNDFFKKAAFESGLFILRSMSLFGTCHFLFPLPPTTNMSHVCIDRGIMLVTLGKLKHHCKVQVESWSLGVPLIWDLSVHFNCSS